MAGHGKGNSKTGTTANYIRLKVKGNEVFISAVRKFDCNLFEAIKGTKMGEFEDLFHILENELAKPMNVRQEFTSEEQEMRALRTRSLQPRPMLFVFFNIFRCSVEGSRELTQMGFQFCYLWDLCQTIFVMSEYHCFV